jgi:N-acetyltransferase 10
MGYGSRAIEELWRYFNGDVVNLNGEESESESEEESESESEEEGGGEGVEEGGSRLLTEKLKPRKKLPPLLLPLGELKENLKLDWIGTSFGLTPGLFKFWARTGMKMLYTRQTPNELTGEYSSIMLTSLPNRTKFNDNWLPAYVADARRRFLR